jgi:epsilon-lactone hydrolase
MHPRLPRIRLTGPAPYRVQAARLLSQAAVRVSLRRRSNGPLLPGWNWFVEVVTYFLKRELSVAFDMHNIVEARRFLDALRIVSPALKLVNVMPVSDGPVRGDWFIPKMVSDAAPTTLFYLHGGGYSFNPKAYSGFISEITLAADARTFALDYRLAPEHRFPAQRDDAIAAYRWLLAQGVDPETLVIGGDSAGGNLTLSLLLALRDNQMPLPALAICLSPATEFVDVGRGSIQRNAPYDWIDPRMLLDWAGWFCDSDQRNCAEVSPINADLRGLPPIYIQAGRAEILYDSIEAFVAEAKRQNADVTFDPFDNMTHVFQMFGYDAPQSVAALIRIREVIDARLRRAEPHVSLPSSHQG